MKVTHCAPVELEVHPCNNPQLAVHVSENGNEGFYCNLFTPSSVQKRIFDDLQSLGAYLLKTEPGYIIVSRSLRKRSPETFGLILDLMDSANFLFRLVVSNLSTNTAAEKQIFMESILKWIILSGTHGTNIIDEKQKVQAVWTLSHSVRSEIAGAMGMINSQLSQGADHTFCGQILTKLHNADNLVIQTVYSLENEA